MVKRGEKAESSQVRYGERQEGGKLVRRGGVEKEIKVGEKRGIN